MEDLIKALQIFLKYKNNQYPTVCEHDTLYIVDMEDVNISEEDVATLNELGFRHSEYDGWISHKYGSA